jgi:protein SCO1/2
VFHQKVRTLPESAKYASVRKLTRRALLCDVAAATMAAVCSPLYAQHGTMGLVSPPVRLDDTWLVDQTGRKRLLSDLLFQGVTALQTIYTGCSSVCPLQGALFSAVQDRMPQIRARYPVRLLSIGIDPLSDSPSALHEWLMHFQAGPAWNAATPTLHDVDRMRMALSGSPLPLGNIANHSTQIYCFDASAMLRWRSADLPRVDEVCGVLGALGRT